jgi:23S rRNA pseudouridine2605 synthase
MRLAKYLASAGVASRRASEEIVRAGRVMVNGAAIVDPARDVSDQDEVALDGRPVAEPTERVVYAVNKPAGVISTARDPRGRPSVTSLVRLGIRLFPVGRLDADTTGLILLTNDGDLAYRLTHPRFEVEKTYRAVVANPPVQAAALRGLRAGVWLEDGLTAPARARKVGSGAIEITIHEGRKRQVRRMCEAVGHPVTELQRVAFGPLRLGDLRPGSYRLLDVSEVDALTSAGTAARRSGTASSGARARSRRR